MSANKITILDETDKTELEQNLSSINTDITNIKQDKADTNLSNVEQSDVLDKIGVLPITNGGTGATTIEQIKKNLNISSINEEDVGNLHVWKKTVATTDPIPPGYKLGEVQTGKFSVGGYNIGNSAQATVYNKIVVDNNGNISADTATEIIATQNDQLVDKFYITSGDSNSQIVWYIPKDVVVSQEYITSSRYNHYEFRIDRYQVVTGYPQTPAKTEDVYLTSKDLNAYQEGSDGKEAKYVIGDVVKSSGTYGFFAMMNFTDSSYFQKISDTIEVDNNGVISHVSPIDEYGTSSVPSDSSYLKKRIAGKYITLSTNSYEETPYTDELPPTGVILYIPPDVEVKMVHPNGSNVSNQYAYFFDRYQPVTGHAAIPATTIIKYLGKLGDKHGAEVLSYVGTGLYGSANKNLLKFSEKPLFVIFPNSCGGFIFIPNISSLYYQVSVSYATYESCNDIWDDVTHTLTWYHSSYPERQYNTKGQTYNIIVFY